MTPSNFLQTMFKTVPLFSLVSCAQLQGQMRNLATPAQIKPTFSHVTQMDSNDYMLSEVGREIGISFGKTSGIRIAAKTTRHSKGEFSLDGMSDDMSSSIHSALTTVVASAQQIRGKGEIELLVLGALEEKNKKEEIIRTGCLVNPTEYCIQDAVFADFTAYSEVSYIGKAVLEEDLRSDRGVGWEKILLQGKLTDGTRTTRNRIEFRLYFGNLKGHVETQSQVRGSIEYGETSKSLEGSIFLGTTGAGEVARVTSKTANALDAAVPLAVGMSLAGYLGRDYRTFARPGTDLYAHLMARFNAMNLMTQEEEYSNVAGLAGLNKSLTQAIKQQWRSTRGDLYGKALERADQLRRSQVDQMIRQSAQTQSYAPASSQSPPKMMIPRAPNFTKHTRKERHSVKGKRGKGLS